MAYFNTNRGVNKCGGMKRIENGANTHNVYVNATLAYVVGLTRWIKMENRLKGQSLKTFEKPCNRPRPVSWWIKETDHAK